MTSPQWSASGAASQGPIFNPHRARAAMALAALSGDEQRITRAEAERQQSEMVSVASLFRDAVRVTPVADGVDALPAVSGVGSMVALPDELLQHIFKQACNVLDPGVAVALSSASNELRTATQALLPVPRRVLKHRP